MLFISFLSWLSFKLFLAGSEMKLKNEMNTEGA